MYYNPYTSSNTHPRLYQLVNAGVPIFNDWWSTYVDSHKEELCRKIIHTYFFEEIGAETPDMFIHYMNAQLERIMPYYNQLYASELTKINPLLNYCIEQSGRSIENLLTKANTSDDKFAKAIRDFAGVTDKSGFESSATHNTGVTTTSENHHDEYQKNGVEHEAEHTDTLTNESEITDKTTDITKHSTTDEKENSTTDTTRNLTANITEKPNETTVDKTDWGATENLTTEQTGKNVSDGSGTKNWTETLDDDSTTKTVTNLSENSSSNAQKDYADTPQTELTASDDKLGLRKDYLTNVTWNSETGNHSADTTQDVTYADDQTKTHKEDTTDKNTTDTTENSTSDKTKGGTDTTTKTHTGTNVTDKTEDETANTTLSRTDNIITDATEKEISHQSRELLSETTSDTTVNKDWTENGTADGTKNQQVNAVSDGTINGNSSSTESTRENSDLSQSSTSQQIKTTEETTDKGTTERTSGFMNVSSSALLEAFRKTFLNIDNMIIEELRDNFMLIY